MQINIVLQGSKESLAWCHAHYREGLWYLPVVVGKVPDEIGHDWRNDERRCNLCYPQGVERESRVLGRRLFDLVFRHDAVQD